MVDRVVLDVQLLEPEFGAEAARVQERREARKRTRLGLAVDTSDSAAIAAGLAVMLGEGPKRFIDTASARAQEHGVQDRVSVKVADVHQLPYDSGQFDVVVAVGVIPWLHSPGAAVVEMARVLRPGGQLVLTADNAARLMSFTDPRGLLALRFCRYSVYRLDIRCRESTLSVSELRI